MRYIVGFVAPTPSKGSSKRLKDASRALANVHWLFVQTRWIGAELSTIARQELGPYLEKGETRAQTEGPRVLLELDAAQSIAVILHELATNSVMYGALSAAEGRIDLSWSHESDGRLELRRTEIGGPPVQTPTREGFRARIIKQLVEQRNGRARFDWHVRGLDCGITVQANSRTL